MMKLFLRQWLLSRLPFLVGMAVTAGGLFGFAALFDGLTGLLQYQLLLITVVFVGCLVWDGVKQWSLYQQCLLDEVVHSPYLSPSEAVLSQEVGLQKDRLLTQEASARKRQEEVMDYFTLWAHQIKTPLTASQLLVKELPDTAVKQGLDAELFRVKQYADMALTYLRLESFHDDLVLEKVDIADLVREVIKKYSLFFIRQQIRLVFDYRACLVVTDAKWLAVVVEQVLSNAIKYTKAGTISIEVSEQEIVISDTGIGIQKSDLERVFERGFSGFNGRMTHQSSGLGLYLSNVIMDQLGHGIVLHSQLGQGTRVSLVFKQKKFLHD